MGFFSSAMEMLNEDADHMFSYYTKQQVVIQDRALGIVEKLVQVLVMVYLVCYVYIAEEGFLEEEAAFGFVATHVSQSDGAAVQSTGGEIDTRFFSAEEITHPALEAGNVFVATRIESWDQQRGVCEDQDMPCETDADCSMDVGAKCSENKYCVEPSWCSATPDSPPTTYKLPTDNLRIWVKSTISFTRLIPDRVLSYANNMDQPVPYPRPGFNTFTVRDLLLLCNPPVRFEEISELGAAIEIQLVWKCQVGQLSKCMPKMQARRVDALFDNEHIGFQFKRTEHMGEDKRKIDNRHGIRLYIRTSGVATKVSLNIIIFKGSTGMALLGFAPLIADLMMLTWFKRRKLYRARKYLISEDLGDFFASLDEEMAAGDAEAGDSDDDLDDEQADEEWKRKMDDED